MENNTILFKEFFNGESLKLNWKYIDTIPEFKKLKDCQQTPKWHLEGNAYQHVKACVEQAYKLLPEFDGKIDNYKRIFLISVLFHDIGKITTTRFMKEDWHSYNHEIEGEIITRRILWDYPTYARETVCSMVRWHMERCGLARCRNIFEKCSKLWFEVDGDISLLYYVMKCDILGSIPQDMSTRTLDLNIIETIRSLATNKYVVGANSKQVKRHIFNKVSVWEPVDTLPTVTMLIGLPGAGKDTFISRINREDTVVICRDDIREELGYCKPNEKRVLPTALENKVSEVCNARMIEAASQGKNIIINNMNLKRKYRDAYKQLLSKYKYQWVYQYIEAPTLADNIKRRDGQIAPEILAEMINKIEWPTAEEFDVMFIEKQS